MAPKQEGSEHDQEDPNQEFNNKAERSLRALFDKARATHELHFAMALVPEMRGMQDGGWNTAEEAMQAYDQYFALIEALDEKDLVRLRVILAFYLHTAECSGFYEIPKKMLLTTEGKGNNFLPFQKLAKKHRKTGQAISPNANTIMKDLMGHSWSLGFHELSETFEKAFDPDIRNAIAHADYTFASDGMRLRRRNGGQVRIVTWDEFSVVISRGINLFSIIQNLVGQYIRTYDPPKTIRSRLNEREPLMDFTIYYEPKTEPVPDF